MGFFDKIKAAINKIKEDNKYLAKTTARINNTTEHYGWVNYKVGKLDPNDDFRGGSYISVENGKGVIYSTGTEDYVFTGEDVAEFKFIGDGQPVSRGENKVPTLRFATVFKDGKKTNIDIICTKVDTFKAIFGL